MGDQTTTTVASPWPAQAPHLKYGMEASLQQLRQGLPDYYPNKTLVEIDPRKQAAWDAISGYTTGARPAAMQAGAEAQLLGQYQRANELGDLGRRWGMQGQRAVEPMAAAAMRAGQAAAGPMSQRQYAGLTPFSRGQYGDLVSGAVNTAHLQPVMDSMAYDTMQAFKPQLTQAREMGTAYQRGGGSRGNLQEQRIMGDMSSALARQAAPMYSQAFQQAQGMRLPAAQMGLGAQQGARQFGLAGGDLRLRGGQLAQQGFGTSLGAGRMGQGALGLSSQVQQQPLQMYGALSQVGSEAMGYGQEMINRDMQKYNYEQMKDRQALQDYLRNVTGQFGGTSTTVAPGPSGWTTAGKAASVAAPFLAAYF
jgi:hypothetical protein